MDYHVNEECPRYWRRIKKSVARLSYETSLARATANERTSARAGTIELERTSERASCSAEVYIQTKLTKLTLTSILITPIPPNTRYVISMPTDLQRRLLSTLIDDLDIARLRTLVMHVTEKHLELVGEEALRIKEKSQDRQPALLKPSGRGIEIQTRRILLSESPAIESTSLLSLSGIGVKLTSRRS